MRRAGFTEEEFAKLADAKANSDALTRTEFAAMNVIDSADPPTEARRASKLREVLGSSTRMGSLSLHP